MGATRTEPNDAIYEGRRSAYLKNRTKLLADAKRRYAEDRPVRVEAMRVMRVAVQQARDIARRRARYGAAYLDMPEGRYESAKAFVLAYKAAKPCLDCQLSFPPYCMDFDHVRGTKKRDVSSCMTVTAAQAEILKCDLVCANCHRKRTYQRTHPPA